MGKWRVPQDPLCVLPLRTAQIAPLAQQASPMGSLCLIRLHLAPGLAAATAIFIQQPKQFISLETGGWRAGEKEEEA